MPFMVFESRGISTLRPASEHWLPARFQRCQLRMQLQRLHVSRGRFRETPLNVINHDQHIQSRSPTEPDKSENTLKDNSEEFFQESASPRHSDKAMAYHESGPGLEPTHPKPKLENPKADRLDGSANATFNVIQLVI